MSFIFTTSLISYLKSASGEVESALRRCEELTTLVDAMVDYREAPELIGAIVGTLVSRG